MYLTSIVGSGLQLIHYPLLRSLLKNGQKGNSEGAEELFRLDFLPSVCAMHELLLFDNMISQIRMIPVKKQPSMFDSCASEIF